MTLHRVRRFLFRPRLAGLLCCLGALSLPGALHAQTPTISAFAGTGVQGNGGDGGPALNAQFRGPTAIVANSQGLFFVADTGNHTIRTIAQSGVIQRYAGSATGTAGFSGDGGFAPNATFSTPRGLAFDSSDNLYVADSGNNRVRKITPAGIITTIAGTGACTVGADNVPATASALCTPRSVAVDSSGNLYIAESGNSRIRRVNLASGIITTVVPTASANGTPSWVTVNNSGVLHFVNVAENRIQLFSGSLPVTAVAGTGTAGFNGDGPALTRQLIQPASIYFATGAYSGTYITDNTRVRQLDAGNITTIAGNGMFGDTGDNGPALQATLGYVVGMIRDGLYLYVVDNNLNRIRRITLPPERPVITAVTSFTGGIRVQYSVAPAQQLQFVFVNCGAGNASGSIFGGTVSIGGLMPGQTYTCTVSATNANGSRASLPSASIAAGIVPQVTTSGPASSVSGTPVTFTINVTGNAPLVGQVRFTDGGPTVAGCDALPLTPLTSTTATASCTVTAAAGNHNYQAIYLGNANNSSASHAPLQHTVMLPQTISFNLSDRASNAGDFMLSATGGGSGNPVTFTSLTMKICALTGVNGTTVRQSGLPGTCTLRASQAGNASYVAGQVDRSYTVTPAATGVALTSNVAGIGALGLEPDGNAAIVTRLNQPTAVVADTNGNIYFCDTANHRVRRVDPAGVLSTVAGGGMGGDGGLATDAELNYPYGIAIDSTGALYVAEGPLGRVRKFALGGTIGTVAGTGTPGYNGDNIAATTAQLNYPFGLAFDAMDNLYIADQENHRVRKVSGGTISTVAGNGTPGFGFPGVATNVSMSSPRALALDAAGNLYIADGGARRVYKVTPAGDLTVIAGSGFTPGPSGDGGPATSAMLETAFGLAIDAEGNLYVSHFSPGTVRKITPGGLISTVAGTGSPGVGGDGGPSLSTPLYYPAGLTVAPNGALLIAEQEASRIRRVNFPAPSLPSAPLIGLARPGATKAFVDFLAGSDGGPSIIDFTVTCTDGMANISVTALLPPITVTGLTNGTSYTCSVKARNTIGTGPASAASNVVVPVVPVPPMITSAPPPDAYLNKPYTYTVTAAGAPAPTFTVSAGNLAAGLTIDPVTGVISGTPYGPTGVTYFGDISAANGEGPNAVQGFGISVLRSPQAIVFGMAPAISVGGSGMVSATGGASGSPVIFDTITASVCTLTGSTVTGVSAGTCTITADQDGDTENAPAPQAILNFTIAAVLPGAPQNVMAAPGNGQATISFDAPASDGGSAIDTYTATCSGVSVSGPASPIVVAPLANGATHSCSVTAHNAAGTGPASASVDVTLVVPISLLEVVSQRLHGNGVGAMDIPMREGETPIEPRSPYPEHRIVFRFDVPITGVFNVEVRNSMGVFATNDTYAWSGNEVVIRSTGYQDGERYTIKVIGVNGTFDAMRALVFLAGDVNQNRSVNSADLTAVKARTGQLVTQDTFRFDVNSSGVISAADVTAVRARSGRSLP